MKTNMYVLHVKGKGYLTGANHKEVLFASNKLEGRPLSESKASELMIPLQAIFGGNNVKMEVLGCKRV